MLQVGYHGLAEAVDRDLVVPLRQPFTPVGAVGVEVALHRLPGHHVAAVVAVADVVRAFQGRESHGGGGRTTNTALATGVGWSAVLQENSALRRRCWSRRTVASGGVRTMARSSLSSIPGPSRAEKGLEGDALGEIADIPGACFR